MKRRQNVLIILFVIAIMSVYTGYEANKPQPIDWSPNFSITKKSPYGTYVIKELYHICSRREKCLLLEYLYENNYGK